MPSIITASELRSALNGVSSTLYSDAILDEIIDTAESVVGNLLVQWNAPIDKHYTESATSTVLHSTKPHKLYATQVVVITGITGHNGSKTVSEIVDDFTFKITTAGATEHEWRNIIPNGLATVNGLSQYADVAGSSQTGLDFVPQPYILGRTIQNRIVGMLGAYIDVEALIG